MPTTDWSQSPRLCGTHTSTRLSPAASSHSRRRLPTLFPIWGNPSPPGHRGAAADPDGKRRGAAGRGRTQPALLFACCEAGALQGRGLPDAEVSRRREPPPAPGPGEVRPLGSAGLCQPTHAPNSKADLFRRGPSWPRKL